MHAKFSIYWCALLLTTFHARLTLGQEPSPAPRRLKVSAVATFPLLIRNEPPKYPDAARDKRIQGMVVLNVVVAQTGEVRDVSVVSGDPILGDAAIAAVKQWKYKPYTIDDVPVEIETEVRLNFHLTTPEPPAPPLGTFSDKTYSNEFFDFSYPLSRDWVRETQLLRNRVSTDTQNSNASVLLAAVHIPEHTAPLEADSSFILSARESAGRSCQQYLQAVTDYLHSTDQAQPKGTIAPLTVAGHPYYRADVDFRENHDRRTFVCRESTRYLLIWNIAGLSTSAIESTISTLNNIGPAQPNTASVLHTVRDIDSIQSKGLLLKQVQPVYPDQARYAGVEGSVQLNVIISKTGEIEDVEVLDGPILLVVSAVNAVRQWKYQPFVLNGEPVEVSTQITVNYALL